MQERVVDIPTRDGQMHSWIFHPDRAGPHPTVILYMDSVGIREELCDMAGRIASVGYYVLVPNLYYRMASQGGLDTVAKAEEAALAALTEDPNSANAYLALGGVYELQGKTGEAIDALEKASELTTDATLTAAIRMRLGMLSQKPPDLPTPITDATTGK